MINFRKVVSRTRFLDPAKDFDVRVVNSEKRYDPLTGKLVRVFPFRKISLPRHDWTPFVEESRQRFCPFCPGILENKTPRFTEDFIPGGKMQVGESTLVPNLHPYETHSAVVVMSSQHYISMRDMTEEIIADSMEAGLRYLKVIAGKDPDNARYSSINWNYMPYAGGSLIHPHIQVISGSEPCNLDREMVDAAAGYFDKNNRIFWDDLVEAEKGGERHLGDNGMIDWLATFAPLAMGDVTAVIRGCSTISDITIEHFKELAKGLVKVIRYYDAVNIPSFNMALYFAGREDRGFCSTARIIGRYTLFPVAGTDVSHMQMLHQDPWTLHLPEEMAKDLKQYF
jgi:galactose-1-phosphate uridylyltransferase